VLPRYQYFRMRAIALTTTMLVLSATPLTAAEDKQDQLLTELKTLTEKAKQERAADRWLQNELETLISRYSVPTMKILVSQDFQDRRFEASKDWTTTSGHFEFDRGYGLVSRVDPNAKAATSKADDPNRPDLSKEEAVAGLLVGLLLKEQRSSAREEPVKPAEASVNPAEAASIFLPTTVSNAFLLESELTLGETSEEARIAFGVFQSAKEDYGYQLRFKSGDRGYVEIQRIRNKGSSVVETRELADVFKDGKSHQLSWLHDSNGQIRVKLDDQIILEASDRAFKDDYQRLRIVNDSGELAIHSLRVSG
jgi:hypothetical protein